MRIQKSLLFLFVPFVLVALACNLPGSAPTPTPQTGVEAALTSLALTQAARQNPSAGQLDFTPAPIVTPTVTPTPTSSIPTVSVSLDTNCRTGPGVVYDYLSVLLAGEKAEVIGKYTSVSPSYWIIKKGSITCWLWGQYATVEGDTSSLPEMVPPPSPTPPPPTATPTTPRAAGDLYIIEIFMSTQFEVIARVGTAPTGSLSGNFPYTVYSNGSQVAQGSCEVPSGSSACWTGYKVTGVESIQVVVDSSNIIVESNEGNNALTVKCDKFGFICN